MPNLFSYGDNLHEMANLVSGKKEKNNLTFAEFLPNMQGPVVQKLMTSLVNDSLKFTSSDTQMC